MTDRPKPGVRPTTLLWSALFVLGAIHAVSLFVHAGEAGNPIVTRTFLDTDAYMWMNRVGHIVETGAWFDHGYPRVNPPEGHVQHWTRPVDALLLAGGGLLGMIWGFADGLYMWGLVFSPVLHLATLVALLWAAGVLVERRLFDPDRLPVLVLIFLAQLPIYHTFLAGRPDHHALLGLLFVLYLGLWMRVLLRVDPARGTRAAVGLGLITALALWVSIEALLYVTLGMVGMGVSWLFGHPDMARRGAIHSSSLLLGLVAAAAIEWGPALPPVREMDTLSVAHLALMALTSSFWLFLLGVDRRSMRRPVLGRFVSAGVGAAAVVAILVTVFPEFLASPLGEVDPLYAETRLTWLTELQPVATLGTGFAGGVGAWVLYAGLGMLALPYLAFRLRTSGDREERVLWSFLLVAVALFFVLAVQQRRWTDYLALSAVLPASLLATDVMNIVERRFQGRRLRAIRPLAVVAFVLGPIILGLALMGGALLKGPDPDDGPHGLARAWDATQEGATLRLDEDGDLGRDGECSVAEISRVLMDPNWFADPGLVLSHTDSGPEILYRTHHAVLSIPNHRPQPGYRLTHEVLGHPEPDEAASLLRDRGVTIVVLCLNDITSGFFGYPHERDPFVNWMARGGIPQGYVLHAATPWVRIYRRGESTGPRSP